MKRKLHLNVNMDGHWTRGKKPVEFYYTTSEVEGNDPKRCVRCATVVDFWYDDDEESTYCDNCTVCHGDAWQW